MRQLGKKDLNFAQDRARGVYDPRPTDAKGRTMPTTKQPATKLWTCITDAAVVESEVA
jgi:hypothetical protein